jgi:Ca2+-binding RTX toxin-like protein
MALTVTYSIQKIKNLDLTEGPQTADASMVSLADGGFAASGLQGTSTDVGVFSASGADAGGFNDITGTNAAITQLSNGNIVIASQDGDSIRYEIRALDGTVVKASTDLLDISSTNADVVALKGASGGFVIVSQDFFSGTDSDIDVQRFDNAGNLVGGVATIDNSGANDQKAAVTALNDGGYVVAFERTVGAETEVWYKVFNENTTERKALAMYDTTGTVNRGVQMIGQADGGFAMVYQDNEWGAFPRITLAQFDANGNAVRKVDIVEDANTSTSDPQISLLSNGFLAVAYLDAGNNKTIVKVIDPSNGTVVATYDDVTGGEPLADNVSSPVLAAFGNGEIAVFHTNTTDGDIDGEHIELVRTTVADSTALINGDSMADSIEGSNGNDIINGGGGNDTLKGFGGADSISGGDDDDVITGGGGVDTLNGGAGDDTIGIGLIGGFNDIDKVDGGTGTDTLDLGGLNSGVVIDLAANTWQQAGVGATQSITGIEIVRGTDAHDTITGGATPVTFIGNIGDDTLTGTAGADLLVGDTLTTAGVTFGAGTLSRAADTNNGSIANAIDVSNLFSLAEDASIAASTIIPHVSIVSTGDANSLGISHFYKVTVSAGQHLSFDFDGGTGFNASLKLYDPNGALVALVDNSPAEMGAGGSADIGDPFLAYTAGMSGEYSVQVGRYDGGTVLDNTLLIEPLANTDGYILNISVAGQTTYEGYDVLNGGAGSDTLLGGAGSDTLNGGTGADVLAGGDGGDFIVIGGDTDFVAGEIIDGGADYDFLQVVDGSVNFAAAGSNFLQSIESIRLDGDASVTLAASQFGAGLVSLDAQFWGAGNGVTVNLGNVTNFSATGFTFSGWGFDLDEFVINAANSSANTITGTTISDVITGGAGADTINGGNGNDTIDGGAGSDVLDGGSHTNTVSYQSAGAGVTVSLDIQGSAQNTVGAGMDTLIEFANLIGSNFNDTLTGNGGSNTLNGGLGDDLLDGFGSEDVGDTLHGGAGNDTLIGGTENDIVDGGTGSDWAYYDTVADAVSVDLNITTQQFISIGAGSDTLTSIENLKGGSFADTLTGNGAANVLEGGSGNDTLDGGSGNDVLTGGSGNDVLTGGTGSDWVYYAVAGAVTVDLNVTTAQNTGGTGMDTLTGIENLRGGNSGDTLSGNASANKIEGGSGNDTINAGAANDTLNGGNGDDVLAGGTGNDWAYYTTASAGVTVNLTVVTAQNTGGAGMDILTGIENILGSNHNDTLIGTSAANQIEGGGGNDILDGGTGNDILKGGSGNDTYIVNAAGDVVTENAGAGTDSVQSAVSHTLGANVENLTLTGAGNATANGNTLNNILTGNSGNNVLNGGDGFDTMDGGAGNDTYIVNSAADVVMEEMGAGTDTVQASTSHTLTVNVENLTLTGAGHSSGNGNSLDNILTGNAKNNSLNGGAGNDTMNGGAGNDTYAVNAAGDVVSEGAGAGNDTVKAALSYTLTDNVENLTLTGAGNSTGTGNTLDNIISGNSGNNTLIGNGGADVLTGGAGNDTMTGGTGMDIFDYNMLAQDGTDVITDFTAGAGGDKLDMHDLLSALGYGGVMPITDGFVGLMQSGADTLVQVDFNGGANSFTTLLTLENVNAMNVTLMDNFIV